MIPATNIFLVASLAFLAGEATACSVVESIPCAKVTQAPVLDGNANDWNAEVVQAPLTGALTSSSYPHGSGNVEIQCVHDAEKVYFLFKIPGPYSFASDNDHKCAAMSTMFKMGELATLFNMGNCPMGDTCADALNECVEYRVDIGGHWELSTTQMGVLYGPSESHGDDGVANKDDEYAVRPECRYDDNDAKAANEWSGAWLHSSAIEISQERAASGVNEEGSYVFEVSRSLKTASEETDAQLEAGKSIDFGFAFWDPTETDSGWSDSGHYVTGCAKDWISLQLTDEDGKVTGDVDYLVGDVPGPDPVKAGGSSGASFAGTYAIASIIAFLASTVFAPAF